MSRVARGIVLSLVLAGLAGTAAFAQRGWGGGFGFRVSDNVPYDGRFVFVRMRYPEGGFRGEPSWAHDYPLGEQNFLRILTALTSIRAHVDRTNVLSFGDPELFRFPVAYLVEPGFWSLADEEATALRDYLLKGGFLIVDDFPYWAWSNFEEQMRRVFPDGQWIELDAAHPIFHSFFEIDTLDIVPAYPQLGERPIFMGLFEDNNPARQMYVIANYQNDLSEFWEHSEGGYYPVDLSNEAYKVGINQFIYGITH